MKNELRQYKCKGPCGTMVEHFTINHVTIAFESNGTYFNWESQKEVSREHLISLGFEL